MHLKGCCIKRIHVSNITAIKSFGFICTITGILTALKVILKVNFIGFKNDLYNKVFKIKTYKPSLREEEDNTSKVEEGNFSNGRIEVKQECEALLSKKTKRQYHN